ncbi:uncharacterized protein LOC128041687 [Gossypium raimondii]|uniref:uncharacterized protein LOC128041687 n=1 Tax=Gossypium raimondii TaxID=29730 RepID=UPI00227D41E5|nr:uncharacterized protein LOC128041687 [Gossypium raimondii]
MYARECIPIEVVMCKRFEDGLNEEIKLLVRILELKEFVVLVDRALKDDKLSKEERRADSEARDSRKRMDDRACFRCGSQEHFIRDCPELSEKDKLQTVRPNNTAAKRRPPQNPKNISGSRGVTKNSTVRSETRGPARAYAIHARENASVQDIITSIFSLYNTNVTALIDPTSTHSYVCTNLVSSKSLLVESTEFVVKVSNPLA